jgi:hypothetical protein
VKLFSHKNNRYVFLLGKREKELLRALLQHYPVLSTDYHQVSRESKEQIQGLDPQLLQEALADRQRENKLALEQFLKDPQRFLKHELGYQLQLDSGEVDWLLQVLNDIRVGNWVKLGSPDPRKPLALQINEQNVECAWAMEMAGFFESVLIEALQPD